MRERELKPCYLLIIVTKTVAPHAGARNETDCFVIGSWIAASLPMRERELKLESVLYGAEMLMSLPMRERELKLNNWSFDKPVIKSLPMRERELKPIRRHRLMLRYCRSPCGSAT